MSYLVLFCSCVFSPLRITITSLGEERANLSAFCTFVRFALVWFCQIPLPLGVWERLRFLIVAPLNFSLTLFLVYKLKKSKRKVQAFLINLVNMTYAINERSITLMS